MHHTSASEADSELTSSTTSLRHPGPDASESLSPSPLSSSHMAAAAEPRSAGPGAEAVARISPPALNIQYRTGGVNFSVRVRFGAIAPARPTLSCTAADRTKGWYMMYNDSLKLIGSTIRRSTDPSLVQRVSTERSRARITVPYTTGRYATHRSVPTSLRPPEPRHHSIRTAWGA